MQPSTIPNAIEQAELIGLNSQIAKAEAKVAADEALADAQERDLRREGVSRSEVAPASPGPAVFANGGSKSPWGTARNPVTACAKRNNLHAKHKMLLQVTAE